MNNNKEYVSLSLEKYNELYDKAKKYDELIDKAIESLKNMLSNEEGNHIPTIDSNFDNDISEERF